MNLYEITYCYYLLRNLSQAFEFFRIYEGLMIDDGDLIERGCFYRLKGDLLQLGSPEEARTTYLKSILYFEKADDLLSADEVRERINALN